MPWLIAAVFGTALVQPEEREHHGTEISAPASDNHPSNAPHHDAAKAEQEDSDDGEHLAAVV